MAGPPAIGRKSGDALDLQSGFSGKEIVYDAAGKARIEEYRLDDVDFDRYLNGVLGEVKGDYQFIQDAYPSSSATIAGLAAQARSQLTVASAYGLPLEWHIREDQQHIWKAVFSILDDNEQQQLVIKTYKDIQ